ncbi:Isoflavone reductase-like protein [Ceratobasidium theobromae]|uniref:Isoflavone reductase-like protein n=1 Tax=Ceratobasidium theobromae TaxID=1582974 RepID=A0A5N5QJF5_9AGAM|nr:Isoflavone reductase-like protein [Ceratobasidium theobromae]
MSGVKGIAVAGASGYVGKPVVDELLKAGTFEIRILTRKSGIDGSVVQSFKARGASLHGVTYEDEAELVEVLQGVDVVLSTLNAGGIMGAQPNLLRAAKKAGAKLFMPSEFGDPFEGEEESEVFRAKRQLHKLAKTLEMPIAVILTGLFPDYCLVSIMGWDFESKKVDIWGTGDEKITWTMMPDIARYLAYVLGHVPITNLQDRVLGIQGDLKTANEVVALWEEKCKDKLQVTYHSVQELHSRLAANPGDILSAVMRETALGKSKVPEPLSNDLYPEWNPKSIVTVL